MVHDRLAEGPEDSIPTISGTPPILSGTPARPPVHRTVYLEAPGTSSWFDPEANHTVGLAMTFLGTFLLTTFLVLAVFYAARTDQDDPAPGLEPTAEAEMPGLEPQPLAAVLPTEDDPPEEPSEGAPAPVGVPDSVSRLGGLYIGTIDGSPVTFDLTFHPEGRIHATIQPRDGVETEANGAYRLQGDDTHIELEDEGAMTVSAYRGKISGQSVSGQITSSTGEIRYFSANR